MEKKKSKKLWFIVGGIIVAITAVVAIVLLAKPDNKKEAYRILKVYEVEGAAVVTRDGIGEIQPYANMVLESGDKVRLDSGKMVIQADEDKFIYLEENTELALEADGTGNKSKTKIELLSGAITNDIQKPLSGDASYEINTPNSTMSVRGTIYRVAVYTDTEGVLFTKVSVFDGKVATNTLVDGASGEDVSKGKEVLIYDDGQVNDYFETPSDIDYSELPEDVIELLITFAENGEIDSIDVEELKTYLDPGPFTVTFMYNGSVFGTQELMRGELVTQPSLMPAPSGSWDYDFSKPVTSDIEINWK